jgi:hypothetical protein
VAAAEPRGDLDHLGALRPDPNLRVARAVGDPEGLDGGTRHAGGRFAGPARIHVGKGNAESRRIGCDPVRDRQRHEARSDRERVDGHLGPLHELLDDRDAAPRRGDRGLDRPAQLARLLDE